MIQPIQRPILFSQKKSAPPFFTPLFFLVTPPFFLKWKNLKFSELLPTYPYRCCCLAICINFDSSDKTRTYPVLFHMIYVKVKFGVIRGSGISVIWTEGNFRK